MGRQGKADQAQQVRERSDQRGGGLCSLREEGSGVAEDRQGEEMPQVPEEEDRLPRPRQEEKGGDAGCAPGNEEEGGCLNVLNVLFCFFTINLLSKFILIDSLIIS